MIKRTLFYWSKMLLKQLSKGKNYAELNKTIIINLIDFSMFNNKDFHTQCHIYNDSTKELITDILEIHFIEMRKFEAMRKEENDKLHKWLSFIINPNSEEAVYMAKVDNDIKKAKELLTIISGNKEITQLAEMREKAIRDEISRLDGVREEQNIVNAKNFLLLGVDEEKVSLGTGLSIEKVRLLKKELNIS